MKEKRKKDKHHKSHKKDKKHERRRPDPSSSSGTSSDEWVEKEPVQQQPKERDDWMSMTGMLKTYTKDDLRPKKEEKKQHIDSYDPSTSTRELNPYWKDGGSGLPKTAEDFRKSVKFLKPPEEDDYYSKSGRKSSYDRYKLSEENENYSKSDRNSSYDRYQSSQESDRKSSYDCNKSRQFIKPSDDEDYYSKRSSTASRESKNYGRSSDEYRKSSHRDKDHKNYDYGDRQSNWRKRDTNEKKPERQPEEAMEVDDKSHKTDIKSISEEQPTNTKKEKSEEGNSKYLSDEKMNKLAAKIVKAEIMGDTKTVEQLKAKLEAAREYRKQNPNAEEEDEKVMLISTNSAGNSRPLANTSKGDARSKGGKRKAETHMSGERAKYFGNDDKYNLAQMFENEKYGNNYDNDAELAKIASKSKNPNDDMADIFVEEISKNRNEAKDSEAEKSRAISQHVKMERTLEGCEYCVESKNMLKHLMVSCGNKTYVSLPSRRSLVDGHCLITTIQHATCVTSLDEDVWEEILNYRKAITRLFNSQNKDVIFYETATRLQRFPHMVINCVPLPRDVGDMAAIYFKKALLECEAEWSMNKKVVDLKGKNIRKGVPKGLPYFWIDFGMDPGFAHVIEDQQLFPRTFAEEIVAGILDLDHNVWKNPRKEYGDLQRKKVMDFLKDWKEFDPVENK